jgi:TrkA domain protein
MEIQETALPGVGLRQEFTTSAGRQLGVVSYRTGRRELLLYDPDDPDACREVIRLIPEEADALADLLGVARLGGRLAELQQQLAGLAISWLTIRDGSPYARGTIADTQARSRTGVSIVAVLREQTAFPAPTPDFGFQPGDTAVVIGTPRGGQGAGRAARLTAMAGDPATSGGARFDRWASTYEASPLQPALFAPVHQTALQLAQQFLPGARRVLDVGCGTGRLLRQARRRYRPAELVGVDLARGMLAEAMAATTTELRIHYLHAGAERLPFTDEVFDLVFATMSMRHWTDLAAGIAEIGRVLTRGGVLVLADVFPSSPRQTFTASLLLRRRRPSLPGELDAALTAHRLALVGFDHTPWFSLPDAQVIAAQRQSIAMPLRGSGATAPCGASSVTSCGVTRGCRWSVGRSRPGLENS